MAQAKTDVMGIAVSQEKVAHTAREKADERVPLAMRAGSILIEIDTREAPRYEALTSPTDLLIWAASA